MHTTVQNLISIEKQVKTNSTNLKEFKLPKIISPFEYDKKSIFSGCPN